MWAKWGPFEEFIKYATFSSQDKLSALTVIDMEGNYRQIVVPNIVGEIKYPSLTSDGEYLLFTAGSESSEKLDIYDLFAVNLCTQEVTLLIKDVGLISENFWRP